jgi:hypothetical protein
MDLLQSQRGEADKADYIADSITGSIASADADAYACAGVGAAVAVGSGACTCVGAGAGAVSSELEILVAVQAVRAGRNVKAMGALLEQSDPSKYQQQIEVEDTIPNIQDILEAFYHKYDRRKLGRIDNILVHPLFYLY